MIPDHDQSEPKKGDVTSNTTVVLLNKKYENLTTGNGFLNFKTVTFGRKPSTRFPSSKLQTAMGKESYRAYMAELSLSDDESDSDIKVCGCHDQYQSTRADQWRARKWSPSSWSASGESPIPSLFLARPQRQAPFLRVCKSKRLSWKIASHELRTPLAVLQNRLETLF